MNMWSIGSGFPLTPSPEFLLNQLFAQNPITYEQFAMAQGFPSPLTPFPMGYLNALTPSPEQMLLHQQQLIQAAQTRQLQLQAEKSQPVVAAPPKAEKSRKRTLTPEPEPEPEKDPVIEAILNHENDKVDEKEEDKPRLPPMKRYREDFSQDKEVVEMVAGRLSLVGNLTKYKLTSAEVHRRAAFPEYMNSSLIGALIRRAKAKQCGKAMREELASKGIILAPGKRKGGPLNTFSALTEGESLAMAYDFNTIMNYSYPSLTRLRTEQRLIKRCDFVSIPEKMKSAARFLGLLLQVLDRVHPPVANKEAKWSNNYSLNERMTAFSLMSHGFGPINARKWAGVFMNMANEIDHAVTRSLILNHENRMQEWLLKCAGDSSKS